MNDCVKANAFPADAGTLAPCRDLFFKPLLPNEPRILHRAKEQALTERYLLPALKELEVFLLTVRAGIDAVLRPAQPFKSGKPYPLGQCLEISLAAQTALRQVNASEFDTVAARGHAAFTAFLKAGGSFRQVWGDLRGEFFQNAFQLGTLYVDVSNDTVVPTKPKVEIVPFDKARFIPIEDFRHYSRIAARYWRDQVFPNHVLPEVAPYCPLIHVTPSGRIYLASATNYMVRMTQAEGFRPSEEVLGDATMPDDLFQFVAGALVGLKWKPARSPAEGRVRALRLCKTSREKRWHMSRKQSGEVMLVVLDANRRLADASSNGEFAIRTETLPPGPAAGISAIMPATPRFVALSSDRHAGKRWRRQAGFQFAATDATVPLVAQELSKAMMSLPLGFAASRSGFMPVAILGIADRGNRFVTPDGRWLAEYVPAAYRSHGFALSEMPEGRLALCIDENSGVLSDAEGDPFFGSDSKPATGLMEMAQLVKALKQGEQATRRICEVLHKHGLLQPWHIKAHDDVSIPGVPGLYRIDEAALNRLPAPAFEEVRQSGGLPLAYCQLLSMQHLPKVGARQS